MSSQKTSPTDAEKTQETPATDVIPNDGQLSDQELAKVAGGARRKAAPAAPAAPAPIM